MKKGMRVWMKVPAWCLLTVLACSAPAQMAMPEQTAGAGEKLGTVSFAVSCAPGVQAPFNRGVALLHDFWYSEAKRQFEQIERDDPSCAMAPWGVAMSQFQQIWNRPGETESALSWAELRKAQSAASQSGANQSAASQSPGRVAGAASTERERAYIAALGGFFKPGQPDYQARIDAYSAAMGRLYAEYPGDVDAGAFYALSLLASARPNDTSLASEHKAMAVLTPLFAKYPDNPGVDHYIIHACDNPAMALLGLAAANHYGEIAPSGAHAAHMPSHIYARLGMWPQDIASNLGSVASAESAELRSQGGLTDEPHAYDFLLYAYLQSGQDERARGVLEDCSAALARIASMPQMDGTHHFGMSGMVPLYRSKLPIFYHLEMRDWPGVLALDPAAGSPPEVAAMTWWARALAAGRLRQTEKAEVALANFDSQMDEVRKGKSAYLADRTARKIERGEMAAWVEFAKADAPGALAQMGEAASLQDKIGQGEVDIPAREMLADMLLALGRPREALVEYEQSLKLSPNRFNGLYNAGQAAEATGDKARAATYYAALLKSTRNGAQSGRPELAHVRSFLSSTQLAAE